MTNQKRDLAMFLQELADLSEKYGVVIDYTKTTMDCVFRP